MANCYAPEADDLHRRWLPRDIFTDIGIVDPEPTVAEEAAAVAAVEEIAVQLVGIIGAGRGKGKPPPRTPSPPPPPPAPAPASAAVLAPHHLVAPACGLEWPVFMTNVCGTAIAAAWPVTPYSPLQWQVASNFRGHSMLPPAAPSLPPPLPSGAMPRAGTGVFLPRTNVFRRAPSPPVKDGKASRPWRPVVQQKPRDVGAAAPAAAAWRPQNGKLHKATSAALALPEDWSYSL